MIGAEPVHVELGGVAPGVVLDALVQVVEGHPRLLDQEPHPGVVPEAQLDEAVDAFVRDLEVRGHGEDVHVLEIRPRP